MVTENWTSAARKYSWTYPNRSKYGRRPKQKRGYFQERCSEAEDWGCSKIELPANLVKKTGMILSDGQILTEYGDDSMTKDYILHSEPHLNSKCRLRWNDEGWVKVYLNFLFKLIEHIQTVEGATGTCIAIEIHPGRPRLSSFDTLIDIIIRFRNELGDRCRILIENRTDQIIKDGVSMAKFSSILAKEGLDHVRYVVDIPALWKTSKGRILHHLSLIPEHQIAGWHIHGPGSLETGHQPPSPKDGLPWSRIARFFRNEHWFLPEVLHGEEKTIDFIEKLDASSQAYVGKIEDW